MCTADPYIFSNDDVSLCACSKWSSPFLEHLCVAELQRHILIWRLYYIDLSLFSDFAHSLFLGLSLSLSILLSLSHTHTHAYSVFLFSEPDQKMVSSSNMIWKPLFNKQQQSLRACHGIRKPFQPHTQGFLEHFLMIPYLHTLHGPSC